MTAAPVRARGLTVEGLREAYAAGRTTPDAVVEDIFAQIESDGLAPVWISVVGREEALGRARAVDRSLPLAGVPFAVKDNIDVQGMPTTAGCPAFAYRAERTATVVTRLLDAGAVLIGKTNMDQFATGLVGTRTPYGACASVFDARYISGGSSSGSAVAVASGPCAFALGTDTAGSGRVPAALNNLVGLKPTRGVLSAAGVVPACRSLDCVSIFALTARDARTVWRQACAVDPRDPYSRPWDPAREAAPWAGGDFRFGTPHDGDLEFFGDAEAEALYAQAVQRLQAIGGHQVFIDFAPFREAAQLLYAGPWVAERTVSVGAFIARHPDAVDPLVADIIASGDQYSAADAYEAADRLMELKRLAQPAWESADVLALPTIGTAYRHEEVAAEPRLLNANLGYYTNFVNLMDLAAIAVPAGFRANGVPFGVSLVGPAFSEGGLLGVAGRLGGEAPSAEQAPPGCVLLAVVGAHLTGEPLNHELTARGARLWQVTRTSRDYRLYALKGTSPEKPALVGEVGDVGPGIDVEVWAMPADRLGGFVAAVPHPLAVGKVRLASGERVTGFVCEPCALRGAVDITHHGGWKSYLSSLAIGAPS